MDRLFFIFMPGCHTCEGVKPLIRKFRDEHPGVRVIPTDITQVNWRAQKWMPSVTPTLVKLDKHGRHTVFDGRPAEDGEGRVITPAEVEAWLQRNF